MVHAAHIINLFFNFLFSPLNYISASWGLFISSAVTGIIMLIIFRYTSNQQKIKSVKDIIKAYILEIRLYKDSPRIIMKAFRQILVKNAIYMRYAIVPLLFVFIPVILVLFNLNARYNYRALSANEPFLIKANVVPDVDLRSLEIEVPDEIEILTPAVHMITENEINWKARVKKPGEYTITFRFLDRAFQKTVIAKPTNELLSTIRSGDDFMTVLMNPAEKPLPAGSPIKSLEITYPAKENSILGIKMHWLIAFFVLSLVFAFALKGPLKVEI